ncbi:MAG: UPF0147 family protein [Candidatus Nanoarchaeia archaeon]|nr:UPF0147 family protein [Candidatus Nanoarchaeia archaeon]
MEDDMLALVETLSQIEQDDSIPKNVRIKLQNAMLALKDSEKNNKMKANRALQELDEVSDDPNMPAYIRPQIWNVCSMLEGF